MESAPIRVLFVEDHDDTRLAVTLLLRRSGLEVESAATCAAALEQLEQRIFDVVVLDLELPDGDGIELCKYVRRLFSGIHIIFYSAHAHFLDIEEAMSHGGDRYLCKPVPTEVLIATIHEVCKPDAASAQDISRRRRASRN